MEHVFVSIGLCQQLLQMNFNMCEACLSLNWCHVTRSLSGQCTILTDLPHLDECVLILQLFITLLQVVYHPLISLQLNIQHVNLGLLLLDDLFQFQARRARINIDECKVSVSAS